MSDVQQGPDWWMASDGRWYPPQSRPAPPPPPPPAPPPMVAPATMPSPPPGALRRISSGLSGTLQGFLWATGAMALFAGGMAFLARSSYAALEDGGFEELIDWADQHDALGALTVLTYLLWIVVFVLLVIWMYKAHAVSKALWPGQRRWSSGWTIGGWFIPLAQFFIPKMVFNEIEKIGSAPRINGMASPDWQRQRTSGIGWAWWVLLCIGLIVTGVGQALLGSDEDVLFASTEDEVLRGYLVQGIGLLCWAVSCVFGALFIRRLGRSLSSPG